MQPQRSLKLSPSIKTWEETIHAPAAAERNSKNAMGSKKEMFLNFLLKRKFHNISFY
jgi:hypothetical protein